MKTYIIAIAIIIAGALIGGGLIISQKFSGTPTEKNEYISRTEFNNLICDIIDNIYAEREYTYPIFLEQGYNPDNYGKEIKNPFTTNKEYREYCNK